MKKKLKTAIVTSLRLGKRTGKGGITLRLRCYYVEKRWVSFMYFIVANIIFLLSEVLIDGCPYRYNFESFPKWFKSYFCRISVTQAASVALLEAWEGHENKKWFVSSVPWLQGHRSVGVSTKLCRFLWDLKELKPILSWKRYRTPIGSCIPKVLILFGRKDMNFENANWWDILKVCNDIIPRSNRIREKAVQVPGRPAS